MILCVHGSILANIVYPPCPPKSFKPQHNWCQPRTSREWVHQTNLRARAPVKTAEVAFIPCELIEVACPNPKVPPTSKGRSFSC